MKGLQENSWALRGPPPTLDEDHLVAPRLQFWLTTVVRCINGMYVAPRVQDAMTHLVPR